MSCEETRPWLDGYLDDELDLVRSLEVERHVAGCKTCAASLETLRGLRTGLRPDELRFPPPRGFERRIARAWKREASLATDWPRRLLPIAAGLLVAATLGWGSFTLGNRQREESGVVAQVESAHVRSLLPGHLLDVPSSDQHTVKPWFNGRLDFSPPVKDFAGQGFPLTGGRLEYLNGKPAAALVYQRRQHVINLFVEPEPGGDTAVRVNELRGFSILSWRGSGNRFWAVSDLNREDLSEFASLVRAH